MRTPATVIKDLADAPSLEIRLERLTRYVQLISRIEQIKILVHPGARREAVLQALLDYVGSEDLANLVGAIHD